MIVAAADSLCPVREVKIRVTMADYLNPEFLEPQKDRDYFVAKSERTQDPGYRFLASCMVKRARAVVENARSTYYKRLAMTHNQNYRKFWADLEQIELKANAKINGIIDADTGEKIPKHQLPEAVNRFFAGVGAKLASKLPTVDNKDLFSTGVFVFQSLIIYTVYFG